MGKHLSRFLIPACLVIALTSVVFIWRFGSANVRQPLTLPSLAPEITPSPSKVVTVEAPDAGRTLSVKQEKGTNGITSTFMTSTKSDSTAKIIFTKTVSEGSELVVPFNTFSPGNKYVLLKEVNPSQTNYFVISATGQPLSKDSESYDITSLFYGKYTDYKITDVTGWGGQTLVVINTDKKSGEKGPSFWFDVASRSFIQLSTRFN